MALQWLSDLQRFEAGRKPRRMMKAPDMPLSARYQTGYATGGVVKDPMGGFAMSGSRFTGNGPDGVTQKHNPTSIENFALHEGEVVIPAAKVRQMGGPENVNSMVEQIAMAGTAKASNMQGFANGGVVHEKDMTNISKPYTVGGVPAVSGAVMTDGVKPYTETTAIATPEERAKALAATNKQFPSLIPTYLRDVGGVDKTATSNPYTIKTTTATPAQRIAATNKTNAQFRPVLAGATPSTGVTPTNVPFVSKADVQLADQATTGLAASQAADTTAFNQQMAQTLGKNAPGGAATAASLMFGRNQQVQTVDLAEAILKDQSTKSWDRGTEMYGKQIDAGDFSGAQKTMDNFGVKIDMTTLQDKAKTESINTNMTNLTAQMASMPTAAWNDPINLTPLRAMATANNMNPDSPDGQKWMENTFKNLQYTTSQEYQIFGNMSDDEIDVAFHSMGGAGEITYMNPVDPSGPKLTGIAAEKAFLKHMSYSGGMTIDANGVVVIEQKAFDILYGRNSGTPPPPEKVTDPVGFVSKVDGVSYTVVAQNGQNVRVKTSTLIPAKDDAGKVPVEGSEWTVDNVKYTGVMENGVLVAKESDKIVPDFSGTEFNVANLTADPLTGQYQVRKGTKFYNYNASTKLWDPEPAEASGINSTEVVNAPKNSIVSYEGKDYFKDDNGGFRIATQYDKPEFRDAKVGPAVITDKTSGEEFVKTGTTTYRPATQFDKGEFVKAGSERIGSVANAPDETTGVPQAYVRIANTLDPSRDPSKDWVKAETISRDVSSISANGMIDGESQLRTAGEILNFSKPVKINSTISLSGAYTVVTSKDGKSVAYLSADGKNLIIPPAVVNVPVEYEKLTTVEEVNNMPVNAFEAKRNSASTPYSIIPTYYVTSAGKVSFTKPSGSFKTITSGIIYRASDGTLSATPPTSQYSSGTGVKVLPSSVSQYFNLPASFVATPPGVSGSITNPPRTDTGGEQNNTGGVII